MFRRLVVVLVLMAALCTSASSALWAQSKNDGHRLWREGIELQEKAQSDENLQKAV